jgi:hypothetical protein
LSAVLVVFLLFFPQVLAGLLADISSQQRAPAGQPSLVSLTSENFNELRTAFNQDSGDVRVVLLLSPT